MKKRLCLGIIYGAAILGISWGAAGHRTVASVAERHLLPKVSQFVSILLDGQQMTDVSSWADEVRGQSTYQYTGSWHFLNLPLGLGNDAFVRYVKGLNTGNIYTAILQSEATLKDNTASVTAREEALKFLIHLVGDAHQPMHVSRREDKGGNTVQLRFDGKGTNLHALWDSKLIAHEHLNDADLADACDKATSAEITQWQNDAPMEWLWESYQISSQLYQEAAAGSNTDEAYYKKWIPVIHKRINQAGIRLAGELNRIFSGQVKITKVTLSPPPPAKAIPIPPLPVQLKDINRFTGQNISVQGKVYGMKDVGSMVLVNVGAAYPNQLLTVVLKEEAKTAASKLEGKTITVSGKVVTYKGKPELVVTNAGQFLSIE